MLSLPFPQIPDIGWALFYLSWFSFLALGTHHLRLG